MKIIFLILVVAAVVLIWLLFRDRREVPTIEQPHPGRGIADEAATAMVDVADQVIGTGKKR